MEAAPEECVEALVEADFENAAALLGEAFFENPAHVYIFPDAGRRRRSLPWLLRRNLEAQAPIQHGFCIARSADGGSRRRIVAMGFWHAPGHASVGRPALLRADLVAVPIRCGIGAMRRLVELTRAIEAARLAALGARPAWSLNNMAVAEELRGSGIGTRLLERELRMRIDPTGHYAALATQRPENVHFYRRLGFEVGSERVLGSGSVAFRNWIMVRVPRSRA